MNIGNHKFLKRQKHKKGKKKKRKIQQKDKDTHNNFLIKMQNNFLA